MKNQIIWRWSKNRKIAFIFFGGTIVVVFLIPILGYINSWKWVGMVTYHYDSSLNPVGVEGIKTFWDWLNLLIIPFVLALAGVWFTHVQSETELEIAADRQRQNILDQYLDKMGEFILDKGLEAGAEQKVIKLARTKTILALKDLDAKRQNQVIEFLRESGLIDPRGITFDGSDFQETDFSGTDFSKVNLERADFRKAILIGVKFYETVANHTHFEDAVLTDANFANAHLKHANFHKANLSGKTTFFCARLFKTDFTEANLDGASFVDVHLNQTDFTGANLKDVDFSRATFEDTIFTDTNITIEQIKQARSIVGNLKLPEKVRAKLASKMI